MDASANGVLGLLLFLVMLVLAPVAISRCTLRLKAGLYILAGMVLGFATGAAIGALLGNGTLAGNLAFQLMWCGGIWASVRKIRCARNPRSAPTN